MTDVLHATFLSVAIAASAVIVAAAIGIPIAGWVVASRGTARRVVEEAAHALLAVPTVLIGLVVLMLLSRSGPLGGLDLLFTPWAIGIGEALLAVPILTALSIVALRSVDPRAAETARALGARGPRLVATLVRENRQGLAAALTVGFARVIAEVGCAMMVGGNLPGRTRTLTTAMVLEAQQRGDVGAAVRLGLVLLAVAVPVILLGRALDRRGGG